MVLGIPTETGVRVGGAVAIGAVLIGGVLLLEHRAPAEQAPVAAVAVAGREAGDVREHRSTLDSDGDGYPDWEEALRGTDPHAFTTVETPTTTASGEPYEPPTTLTGQFAEDFLEGMVRASAGRDLTPEEKVAFVEGTIDDVAAAVPDTLYTRADLSIARDDSLGAWRTHGNAVGTVLIENNVESDPELVILQRATTANDPALLAPLTPIADAYGGMVRDLLALTVPTGLAKAHLDLINTISMIETDIRAMSAAFDDPLRSLVRIQRYQDDAAGLFYAIDNLRTQLEKRGVAYTSDESGIVLFSLRP